MYIFSLMCQRASIFVYIKIAVSDVGHVYSYFCGRQKNNYSIGYNFAAPLL